MPPDPSIDPAENTTRFGKLLAGLVRSGVDFAVVGGLAVIFNGYERLTLDADILIGHAPDNVRRLLDQLSKWGEGWARELSLDDFAPREGSIRVMEEFDLDIFTQMQGKSLDDFRPRLRSVDISGVPVSYLSAADLIFLKEGSWRDKDKLDVLALKEVIAREGG